MKVHLYGNTLNNSYNLTQFLRAKGIEAEMFLDNASPSAQDYPWWEDSNLTKDTLPDWIHYYPIKPNFHFPGKKFKALIEDFSKCDIALVCGFGPIIAQKAKIPYLFFSYGSDLNITAFWENLKAAFYNVLSFKKPKGIISLFLYSHLQKKALMNADRLAINMGYQVNNYLKPLGVDHKVLRMRLAWDTEKYKIPPNPELTEKYKDYEVIYFMQARHTWKSIWNDWKGNDKFIKAFAAFVKDIKPNVRLVMINKGPDLKESKELIKELEIESYVEWVEEMNKDGIRAYNSIPNVVIVDQFWHDKWFVKFPGDIERPAMGFGSGSVEAMSAGKPLITAFFDEDFYDGESPPILSAFTTEEIYHRLVESIEIGEEGRRKLGTEGQVFVKKYHNWEIVTNLYIQGLVDILADKKFKKH